MKKFLPLILIVAIVLSGLGLTGCGSKSAQEQPTSVKSAKEESVADLLSKGKQIESMTYDFIITAKDSVINGKVWMQGKKIKTEGVVEGQKSITFYDGETNTIITYIPDQDTAIKLTADKSKKPTKTPGDYSGEYDATKMKVLETTVYDGVKCKVLEVADQGSKSIVKMWVREDNGVPVKIETNEPDVGKFVIEYKNMNFGPIPADVFQLPAGIKVTDMNEIMKDLPQMSNMPEIQ